jgi:alkanesulfonate monooxygenase SsuD/methylene tetrahydromethanopterin reductase-like flavin-dependent oxidoreductase (luciferase family)
VTGVLVTQLPTRVPTHAPGCSDDALPSNPVQNHDTAGPSTRVPYRPPHAPGPGRTFRRRRLSSDFTDRIWQGVFSGAGSRYAAAAGSNLLLNRATYGYEEPTDVVQRPWAEEFLAEWQQPHRPRIGLSRFIFPARDKRAAISQIEEGVLRGAATFVERGQFPASLSTEEYLRRFHAFYGHPDEIVQALQAERVMPVATDLIAQFNPGIPDRDAAIRALELLATEVAPSLGWSPAPAAAPAQVTGRVPEQQSAYA